MQLLQYYLGSYKFGRYTECLHLRPPAIYYLLDLLPGLQKQFNAHEKPKY